MKLLEAHYKRGDEFGHDLYAQLREAATLLRRQQHGEASEVNSSPQVGRT